MTGEVHQRVHLGVDARGLSRAGALGLLGDLLQDGLGQRDRCHRELPVVRHLGEAGERIEHLGDVLAQSLVGGEHAQVGVEPRGGHVVVAGGEVDVAPDLPLFLPHDEDDLGVGLQAHRAVEDVDAGALQLARPDDVVLLVEARLELDGHRDLLAVLGRGDERLHDLRVRAGAVQRHLDRQDRGVLGRAAEEVRAPAGTSRRGGGGGCRPAASRRTGPGPRPARG